MLVYHLLSLIPDLIEDLPPFLGVLADHMVDFSFQLLANLVFKYLLLLLAMLLLELINDDILEILILFDELVPEYLLIKLNNVGILFKFLVFANFHVLKCDILRVFIVSVL